MAQSIAEIGDYYFVLPFFRSRVYRLATDPWHVAGPGGMRVALTTNQKRVLVFSALGTCMNWPANSHMYRAILH